MRLLTREASGKLVLEEYYGEKTPRYAILSHTWGADSEEVNFQDLMGGRAQTKAFGYRKIEFCWKQALNDRIKHVWIDTCCIDKTSSAELSEAINSMFSWYQKSARCYVYLPDVSTSGNNREDQIEGQAWEADFRTSRWFRRGWTLQELLAPESVEFFSREGNRLGNKRELEDLVHNITGISFDALRGEALTSFNVEERMSWAKHRETKRPEDKAYSLLGIFGISMSSRYGEGGDQALQRLERKIAKSTNTQTGQLATLPSPSSTVPFRRDADFVDRTSPHDNRSFLEQIEERCSLPAARVALVGIGGAGKSQLAIEYSYRLRDRSPQTWVFWVYASNADRLRQGFVEIAERMNIPGYTDPSQNLFGLVAKTLRDETKGTWLLVLDNLDDDTVLSISQRIETTTATDDNDHHHQQQQSLTAYLPQSSNGKILITTRVRNVANMLVEPRDQIPVDSMVEKDAIQLLKKKLDDTGDDDNLGKLVSMLEYMPLAIVQAASYIREKGSTYSICQYIEAFQSSENQKTSLLNYQAGQLRRDPDAQNSIIVSWQISFEDIRKKWPASADLLSLMSYFDRQGIPAYVLQAELNEGASSSNLGAEDRSARVDGHLLRPKKKGPRANLIKSARKAFARIHIYRGQSSTNELQLSNVQGGGSDDDIAILAKSVEGRGVESDVVSEVSGAASFELCIDRLRSYSLVSVGADGQTFEMHALVQLATRRWLEMNKQDRKWKEVFYKKLCTTLPSVVTYDGWDLCEALFPHWKAAEIQRPVEVEAGQDWAQILGYAGAYRMSMGSYAEAARLLEKSTRLLQQLLGREHQQTVGSETVLAQVYYHQGRFTEAEQFLLHSLQTLKNLRGKDDLEVSIIISYLAKVYGEQERWTEAEQLHNEGLEICERLFGKDDQRTLDCKNDLAVIYLKHQRVEEAEKLHSEVLESRSKVLGEEHPKTLTSIVNLASTYNTQGRFEEAEELEVRALNIETKILGPRHPSTLETMNNLAITMWNLSRAKEAIALLVNCVQLSSEVLGNEHYYTRMYSTSLAEMIEENEMQDEMEQEAAAAGGGGGDDEEEEGGKKQEGKEAQREEGEVER